MVVYVFKAMSNKSKKAKDTIVLRPMKIRTRGEWMSCCSTLRPCWPTHAGLCA
jgi:hypothetical protein